MSDVADQTPATSAELRDEMRQTIRLQAATIEKLREAMHSALAHRYGYWPVILDKAIQETSHD